MQQIHDVAIDAQLTNHKNSGGVATHLAALVNALGKLSGPEHYHIVCAAEDPEWLRPYIGPNQTIVLGPKRQGRELVKRVFGNQWMKVWTKGYKIFSRSFKRLSPQKAAEGLGSDMRGFYELLPAKVVHVFYQTYIRTDLPMIFNPHDLQHEHFPDFFDPIILSRRKHVYRTACLAAAAIVAGSQFTKNDVVKQYGVIADKIWVIPLAPAMSVYPERINEDYQEALRKYEINSPFIYYPAATWEHKNHIRLLEVIFNLRKKGLPVNLVCSGALLEPCWSNIQKFINEHNLKSVVKFLGFLPGDEVQALYRTCNFVIAPSLYEQASGPMMEAWQNRVPIAASNVTSLPEQAGDAALLFDPYSIQEIEETIVKLWSDNELSDVLRQRGERRLSSYSWEKTAKSYRALYRYVAGWPMSNEDQLLID